MDENRFLKIDFWASLKNRCELPLNQKREKSDFSSTPQLVKIFLARAHNFSQHYHRPKITCWDVKWNEPTRWNDRWDIYCSCSTIISLFNPFRGARESHIDFWRKSIVFGAKIDFFQQKSIFFPEKIDLKSLWKSIWKKSIFIFLV